MTYGEEPGFNSRLSGSRAQASVHCSVFSAEKSALKTQTPALEVRAMQVGRQK